MQMWTMKMQFRWQERHSSGCLWKLLKLMVDGSN